MIDIINIAHSKNGSADDDFEPIIRNLKLK